MGSIPLHPSGGYLLRSGPAASRTPDSQTGRPHGWQPYLHREHSEKQTLFQSRIMFEVQFVDADAFTVSCLGVNVSWALTRVVDGVQVDSFGSDEESDPLQLAVSYIVLEHDVIGEVHVADWLERGRALAADWDATVLVVSLHSHVWGHGALIVLHNAAN